MIGTSGSQAIAIPTWTDRQLRYSTAELGFARLAIQSGVKSALASLWYISDEGTLALMKFYNHLGNHSIKAKA